MKDSGLTRSTFSGTSFGGWYFLFQAFAFSGWWLYLYTVPDAVPMFVPPGAAAIDLNAFRAPDLIVAVPASLAAGVAFFLSLRWAVPLGWLAAGAVIYAFVYCVAWSIARDGAWLNVALMAPAALFTGISALDISADTLVIFRRAAPLGKSRHVAATVCQIVVFWSFFLVVIPTGVMFVERELNWPALNIPARRIVGALMFIGFSSLGLASGLTISSRGDGTPLPFDATNRLVTTGPYAYLRNPMVVAGLGQGAAVGVWLGSWAVLAYVFVGGLIWEYLVRPAEERDLRDTFGDEFAAYCTQVRCWIPRSSPYRRVRI